MTMRRLSCLHTSLNHQGTRQGCGGHGAQQVSSLLYRSILRAELRYAYFDGNAFFVYYS